MASVEEQQEQENQTIDDAEEKSINPMAALLEEKGFGAKPPRRGEIRTGTIARVTDNGVLVDIGYKSEGVIPGREFEQLSPEQREELKVGEEVTVYVLRTGGRNGTVLLSLERAEEEKDWVEAEKLLESKEVFEGVISGYNKGGLIAKLGRIRGFVPSSQVSMSRRWRAEGDSPDERWGEMVGEPIVAKVIEVERKRNRLILSERAAAREARNVLKERLIKELQPGEVRKGHVISLADFGAFVDIGGADGLVHTSEISWKRTSHPRDVLKIGQEVQVKVLSVDAQQKRISLSLREMEEDPWDTIIEQFNEGQLVEGSVTKLTKFGAFASLMGASDYEVEGLIHISELSDRHIVHPREVVSEEETLTLRIIRVDRERRRIGLSLKRVDSPEYAELDWQAAMQQDRQDEETEQDVPEASDSQGSIADPEAESNSELVVEQTEEPEEVKEGDEETVSEKALEAEAVEDEDQQDEPAALVEEEGSGADIIEAENGHAPDMEIGPEQSMETEKEAEASVLEQEESEDPDPTPSADESQDKEKETKNSSSNEEELDDEQETEETVMEASVDQGDTNGDPQSLEVPANEESGESEG